MHHVSVSNVATSCQAASRIENDTETVRRMTDRIESTTRHIIRHARALGYYEPTPEMGKAQAPTAVVATLADALNALDRAIDCNSGSLNVFD